MEARQFNTKLLRSIAENQLSGEGFYTQAERVNAAADLIEEMKEALWEASNSLALASSFLPRETPEGYADPFENNRYAQSKVMSVLGQLDDESAF
jgi:hypothetical protein